VRVPQTYDFAGAMTHCYMFRENVSAACASPPEQSSRTVRTTTHVGRYPPAYYLAVGWPSLLTSSVTGIYLMQAASAVLCATFLAMAVATARHWSRSPLLVPAISVAITPMALFLNSSINPSGLEVATAATAWTAATVLVADHLRSPPAALVAVLAISTAVMVWTRPTALAWPVVIAAVLAPAVWGRLRLELRGPLGPWALVRPWLQRRAATVASAGVLIVAAAGALAWVLLARATRVLPNFTPLPASSSFGHVVGFIVGRFPSLLAQGVGNFGWLDTPVPPLVLALWAVLCAGFVALAIMRGSKATLSCLALAVLASFLVPVVTLVGVAHSDGYAGQGRYFLAIWEGVPIVAAGLFGVPGLARAPRRWAGPVSIGTGLLVGTAQAIAFYWALRRYIVGIPGPLLWSGSRNSNRLQWHPPVPGWWLLGVFVALCAVYGAAISRLSRTTSVIPL